MALKNTKMFATMLAVYVKKNLAATHRGAMLIRCVNDGAVVAAIYGNDNYLGEARAQREVELVRRQLSQSQVQEVAFGLSPDGASWALLVRAKPSGFKTEAGKAFHMEMFRLFLEDTVEGAWDRAGGPAGAAPGRSSLGLGQPAG
jgi:hypothetical protein